MEFAKSSRDLSREEACVRLARILSEQFPDEELESLTASEDLEHSLSGNYPGGLLRRGSIWARRVIWARGWRRSANRKRCSSVRDHVSAALSQCRQKRLPCLFRCNHVRCGGAFYSSASGTLAGVYLVAPALRFGSPNRHLATIYFDISPQIEFVRVGVAEGWRRGLRVVMRR
jgi:hypothetical protein